MEVITKQDNVNLENVIVAKKIHLSGGGLQT